MLVHFCNFTLFLCRKVPSLLEYFSYLFHYSTILAGPVCTFREFNDFIDGSDIRPKVMYHARVKSAYVCYSLIDDKVRENTWRVEKVVWAQPWHQIWLAEKQLGHFYVSRGLRKTRTGPFMRPRLIYDVKCSYKLVHGLFVTCNLCWLS